jgi:hypothetical protein
MKYLKLMLLKRNPGYGYLRELALLWAAHLALSAATILARPSADSLPFFLEAGAELAALPTGFTPFFCAAHRALSAATILARPSGESLPFFFGSAAGCNPAGAGLEAVADAAFAFAQRAFKAAEILARAAAPSLPGPLFAGGGVAIVEVSVPPRI